MAGELKIGLTGKKEEKVTKGKTAVAVGSGNLAVYATPWLVALMEGAAVEALKDKLSPDTDSVGISLEVMHLAATPVGMNVKATAKLINIEGKKLVFEVEAYDEVDKIGSGIHQRYLVNKKYFLARCEAKKEELLEQKSRQQEIFLT